MKRVVAAVAVTASTAVVMTALALPAAAAPSFIKVRTPGVATAYNHGAAKVTPLATATGRHVLVSKKLTVYRAGKKYRSGSSVKLNPGSYRTITSGSYRSYSYVKQTRTRKVLHEGDVANARCVVRTANDEGYGYTDSLATCTNSYYPSQSQTDEEFDNYQVGAVYYTSEYFDDEYVSKAYTVNVRKYGAAHRFSSPARKLTVRRGGFRHVYTGHGNYQTRSFAPPKSVWRIVYSFSCSSYSNFSIEVYRSNGAYEDLAANDLGRKGGNRSYEHAKGKFYLDIGSDSTCNWRAVVTS